MIITLITALRYQFRSFPTLVIYSWLFSRTCHTFHVFPRLSPVTCSACAPSNFFPRLPPVSHFPALVNYRQISGFLLLDWSVRILQFLTINCSWSGFQLSVVNQNQSNHSSQSQRTQIIT